MSNNNLQYGFVAVHAGAGFHPTSTRSATLKACKEACTEAYAMLAQSDGLASAVDVCVAATVMLENDPITNAGFGSNLTATERVECDAGLMDGCGSKFAGIGCVRNVRNPILAAKKLLDLQSADNGMSSLVPPVLLAGDGAMHFAKQHGLEIVSDVDLITNRSLAGYRKALQMVSAIEAVPETISDTVGVIVVNKKGQVAASCSSGGPLLKLPGRIGHSAQFGCGAWTQENPNTRQDTSGLLAAISCTGCGEYLTRTSLAKTIGERLFNFNGVGINTSVDALHSSLYQDYLNSAFLTGTSEDRKVAGAIALKTERLSKHEILIDFAYGHCSRNMCLAYTTTAGEGSSYDKHMQCVMSECPETSKIIVAGKMYRMDIIDANK